MTKRNLNRILIIWALPIFLTALLGKTSIASDNGRASADFLNIGVSARAAALGCAYTAVADDATASYWNSAGLAYATIPQISFSHFAWYQDLSFDYLSISYPASKRVVVSGNAEYLSYGTIEGYDAQDNPTGAIGSTYDMAVGLALGYRLGQSFSVGLGAKYIMTSLAGIRSSAPALDLGARCITGKFSLGLALANVGSSLKFEGTSNHLPTNLRAGVAIRPFRTDLIAALELEQQFYGELAVRNGFEFGYQNRYFVRAGYSYYPSQEGREFGQSLSFGVGAILGPSQFDYTFSPQDDFSSESIHRFSVTFRFQKQ